MLSSLQTYRVDSNPILEMGKLRHNKAKYFLQVHTAEEEQLQEVNPGCLAQKRTLKHCGLLLFITHFSF